MRIGVSVRKKILHVFKLLDRFCKAPFVGDVGFIFKGSSKTKGKIGASEEKDFDDPSLSYNNEAPSVPVNAI